jgi:hypothetical protein
VQGFLTRSPEIFPHSLDSDGERIAFIRLTQADYRDASFLDARILTPRTAMHLMSWREVADALRPFDINEHCSYIFHVGHVGSTLLSRLIGAHPSAFVLREPLLLRAFAQMKPEAARDPRLSDTLKLFSRTFEARQSPVIKATSFVSELAPALLSRTSAPEAIMMSVAPESYFATILGGPNSRQESKVLAPSRLMRLQQRLGEQPWDLSSLSEGEVLALTWACEMSVLIQAWRLAGRRALWVDFDQFLADPTRILSAVLRHLGFDASAETVASILAGPDMLRYSKAPEHAYDAQLRTDVLNHARAMHRSEIREGLEWLERAAARFSLIHDTMEFKNQRLGNQGP